MKLSRNSLLVLAFVALCAALALPSAHAFAWRLFAGREECINAYLPDRQWKHIQKTGQVGKAEVMVDAGFLITTKHDVEDDKANVDYGVYSPSNKLLTSGQGVSEGDVETNVVAESSGPYKLCVRVSGGKLLRPSVIVDISYFSVYYDGDDAGSVEFHSGEDEGVETEKDTLATHEQISDIENGLAKLDRYMHNVTSETRFLYARTLRHLRTAQSTLARTKWYYFAVYSIIVSSSVAQIAVIRFLFRKNQRGLMML
jgi:p24 family protein beta-1